MLLWLIIILGLLLDLVNYVSLENYKILFIEFPNLYYPVIYIIVSILYLLKYRKDNLMCFEFPFLIIYFIIIFFKTLILDNLGETMKFGLSYLSSDKSTLVNMIAFYFFMMGSIFGNKLKNGKIRHKHKYTNINFSRYSFIVTIIAFLYVIFLAVIGNISSWFHYSSNGTEYSNAPIVYLTILLLVNSVFEFMSLRQKHIVKLKNLLKSINKFYLGIWTLTVSLLLLSGNRNECLLILCPPLILYSILIKKIPNKVVLTGMLAGWLALTVIGVVRQSGVSVSSVSGAQVGIYEGFRDYAVTNMCTTYLIELTDNHDAIYFNDAITGISSAIPFLGGLMNEFFPVKNERSTIVTTNGILGPNAWTGLGTSLIGDLYYYGKLPFVILYMFLFGWLIAYLFTCLTKYNYFSVWYLTIYSFFFANVLYCLRAEWMMSFRYLGFGIVLIFILKLFDSKHSNQSLVIK